MVYTLSKVEFPAVSFGLFKRLELRGNAPPAECADFV
jgi:hypothetical protein